MVRYDSCGSLPLVCSSVEGNIITKEEEEPVSNTSSGVRYLFSSAGTLKHSCGV